MNVFALFLALQGSPSSYAARGSIITTASIQATHPRPSILDHAPTKAAILAFTRALARQVAEVGIRVAPGPCGHRYKQAGASPTKFLRSGLRHP